MLVIRPIAVWAGTLRGRATGLERGPIAWFGIRGIESIYYLAYATAHGLDEPTAARLTAITFVVVAASIILPGISVTPLMKMYGKKMEARRARRDPSDAHEREEPTAVT